MFMLEDQYQQRWLCEKDPRTKAAQPCPFCGNPMLTLSRMGNYVHCPKCKADGPEVPWKGMPFREDAERQAVKLWNKRAMV